MWFIGVEVEQETSAPPPKKNPGSAPDLWAVICRSRGGLLVNENEENFASNDNNLLWTFTILLSSASSHLLSDTLDVTSTVLALRTLGTFDFEGENKVNTNLC